MSNVPDNDLRDSYLWFWSEGLRELLGWDDIAVNRWLNSTGAELIDTDWVYHEEPIYWLAPTLVRDITRGWTGLKLAQAHIFVAQRVAGHPYRVIRKEDFEWKAASVRFHRAVDDLQRGRCDDFS